MEAVAAVGVAAAAVQFLDYSVKTLTLCKEIRDSPSGSTKANGELTTSINKLTAMQKDLRKNSNATSSTYRQLIRTVQECAAVSTELLQLLEHIRDQSRKSAGVVRAAWQAMKKRKTIERLQERLGDCQTKYHLALTTDMRDEVLRLLEDQGKSTKSIHDLITKRFDFTRDQIQALDENVTQLSDAAQKQLSALGNRQQQASAGLRRGQHDLNRNIDSQFSKLSTSSTQQDLLDSLYFPEMFARQESMKRNSPGTYEWVFGTEDREELGGRIKRWLRETHGPPVFWISGKPGSGKSSLMAFIMSDERTFECLETWAGNRVPYIFSFFFWKPGVKLQKTLIGFMRSLVWQICKAKSSIIDHLVSQDTTLLYSPWSEAKLAKILRLALLACRNDPLMFVIDGLDECEDNHNDLLGELQVLNINPHTKVCVSSRPDQSFCQRLEALPSVRLQDLNYGDVLEYAYSKLGKGDTRTKRLAERVALKAEGVFLWAVLVCDSLCSGLMAQDDDETLLQRLYAYPQGLDDLFDSMFANLEEVHYNSLAFYFYAAQQSDFSVALAVASQPTQPIESLEQFGAMCEREATRITQQSKGLLHISARYPDRRVCNCAWSLKDVRTGSTSLPPLQSTAVRLAKEHLRLNIAFVHRSAHDYVFGDNNADSPVWLQPVHRDETIRKVLKGALWLAQYGPILHVHAGRLRTINSFDLMLRSVDPADVLEAEQKWLCKDLERYFHSIDSWTSAMKDYDQVSQHMNRSSEDDGSDPQDSQLPLRRFWQDMIMVYPDFVASRSCHLWDRDDTYLNVAAILNSWYPRRSLYRPDMYSAIFSVATEFLRRGLPYKQVTLLETQRRHYSVMSQPRRSEDGGELISWKSLSTCHEAFYVLQMTFTATLIARNDTSHRSDHMETGSIPLDQLLDCVSSMEIGILEFYCALVQGWQLFYAVPRYVQKDPLPLQLSIPMLYKYPPTSRYLNYVAKKRLLSCRTELRLQLSCFSRKGPNRLRAAEFRPIPVAPIASYCLSLATTRALLMFIDVDYRNSDGTTFVGSVADISGCIELVMGDIWDDVGKQLTAWDQLYLRTCVKFYFPYFWETRAPGVEAC